MSVSIARNATTLTFDVLVAQPATYAGTNVQAGSTARIWEVQGLCSHDQFKSLIDFYDEWRDAKIAEEDPATSLVIGEHFLFTGTGPGGLSWTNLECWFEATPKGSVVSSQYMAVEFTIIDAAQSIETIIKDGNTAAGGLEPDFGTYVFTSGNNQATVYLTEYPDGYTNNPTIDLTVFGFHYISGAFHPYPTKRITGRVIEAEVVYIKEWYEAIIRTHPPEGTWYPTSEPEFGAEYVGTTLWYTVNIDLILLGGR